MGTRRGPSFSKLEKILRRQGGLPKWGSAYEPANAMDDLDAPGCSRPRNIFSPSLGRWIHAQSRNESYPVLLALHCPLIFELHEQKMLQFNPSAHPLSTHPNARGLELPRLRGTLALAEELKGLNHHPMVRAPKDHPRFPGKLFPFPYIGDLLLFLIDELGPWCVNWSIKLDLEDFKRTFQARNKFPSEKDREKAEFRHELEKHYYLDGLISTHHLAGKMIDRELRVNLKTLHHWWARGPEEPRALLVEGEMVEWYRQQIPKNRIMFDMEREGADKFHTTVHDAKWILKKGIFSRTLRVDLFRTVQDNLPLYPEIEDPFVRYGNWFSRGQQ